MENNADFRKLYLDGFTKNWKTRRKEASEVVRKKDAFIAERKAHILEAVKSLISSENLQNPAKELTVKLLQSWIDNNPDKFFGLTTAANILQTYFFGELKILKFSLGLIKEEQ